MVYGLWFVVQSSWFMVEGLRVYGGRTDVSLLHGEYTQTPYPAPTLNSKPLNPSEEM